MNMQHTIKIGAVTMTVESKIKNGYYGTIFMDTYPIQLKIDSALYGRVISRNMITGRMQSTRVRL